MSTEQMAHTDNALKLAWKSKAGANRGPQKMLSIITATNYPYQRWLNRKCLSSTERGLFMNVCHCCHVR